MEYSCYEVNVSDDSINETAWTYISQSDFEQYRINGYVLASSLTLLLLVGSAVNLLVVAIIIKHQLYAQPTFILLLNLSMTDFLLCILVMPFHIVTGFSGEFLFGNSDLIRCRVCKTAVVLTILIAQSLYSVSLLSIDRFLFIKKPLRYHKIVTIKKVTPAILVTWVISISIGLPPLFGVGQINYSQALFHCTLDIHKQPVYTLILVFASLPPLLVFIVSTLWVACIAQKQLRKVYKMQLSFTSASDQQEFIETIYKRAQKKKFKLQFHLVQVFGAIIIANVITWLPMLGWICAAAATNKQDIPLFFKSIAYISFLMQPVLHPVLEASLISDIKVPLRKIIGYVVSSMRCKHYCKQNSRQVSPAHPAEITEERVLQCNCGMVVNGVSVGRVGGVWVCSVCGWMDMCSLLVLPPADDQPGQHSV